jgi:hypothetical protein
MSIKETCVVHFVHSLSSQADMFATAAGLGFKVLWELDREQGRPSLSYPARMTSDMCV